jgi:hypothetical protein
MDEMLAHVESKFLLEEKGRGDLVVQTMEEAEHGPRGINGNFHLFYSLKDFVMMRPRFILFEPRYEAVKEILDRVREERAGVGRGDD